MWISRASQHLSEANAFKGKSNLSTVTKYDYGQQDSSEYQKENVYHKLWKVLMFRSQPNSKDLYTCPFQTCKALHSNAKQGITVELSSIGSYTVYMINQG